MSKEEAKKKLNELLAQEQMGYFWIGNGYIASGIATVGQVAAHYAEKTYLTAVTSDE